MWVVVDYQEGLIGVYPFRKDAEKAYNKQKQKNIRQFDGEFNHEEDVILAKVENRFYSVDTGDYEHGKPVWDWDEINKGA
jgi:hypothetical protein